MLDQLEFPSLFSIKVIGESHPDFENAVVAIIEKNGGKLRENGIKNRASKTTRFVSLTLEFHIETRQALEAIYIDLHAHELVQMTL